MSDHPIAAPTVAPTVAPTAAPTAGTSPALPAVEEGLVADRMRFWSAFTGTTTRAAIVLAIVLILLAIFVV